MATRAFDDTRSDRPAVGEIGGIVHIRQVTLEIVGRLVELLSLGGGGLFAVLSELTKFVDEVLGVAGKHLQGALGNPVGTLRVGFSQ